MIGVIQGLCIGICTQTRNYWKVKLFFDATEVIKTSSTSCGYMKMDFSDQSKTQRILQSHFVLCVSYAVLKYQNTPFCLGSLICRCKLIIN